MAKGPELPPCPDCKTSETVKMKGPPTRMKYLHCSNCGLSTSLQVTEEEAIKIWKSWSNEGIKEFNRVATNDMLGGDLHYKVKNV